MSRTRKKPAPQAEQPEVTNSTPPDQQKMAFLNQVAGEMGKLINTINQPTERAVATEKLHELCFWVSRGVMLDHPPGK